MKILNLEQGTSEWLKARTCMITGTRMSSVMGTKWEQLQLICELIAEEGTEQAKQFRVTPEMERGTAEEPFAVKFFEQQTKKKTQAVGFCISDEFSFVGLSPDRLIEKDGKFIEGVEIKNPDTKTMIFYKLASSVPNDLLKLTASKIPFLGIPNDYKYQVLNYFLVCESIQKMNFVTYDARIISDNSKMLLITIDRDEPGVKEELEKMRQGLLEFKKLWDYCKTVALPVVF